MPRCCALALARATLHHRAAAGSSSTAAAVASLADSALRALQRLTTTDWAVAFGAAESALPLGVAPAFPPPLALCCALQQCVRSAALARFVLVWVLPEHACNPSEDWAQLGGAEAATSDADAAAAAAEGGSDDGAACEAVAWQCAELLALGRLPHAELEGLLSRLGLGEHAPGRLACRLRQAMQLACFAAGGGDDGVHSAPFFQGQRR